MSVVQSGFTVTAPTAPTVAVGTATGSLTPSDVYQYLCTYVTGFGETGAGASASVTVSSTGSVNLTAIPVSANTNVIHRNIYRTAGNGSQFLLLHTINDNKTTTYVDTAADASLGAQAPTFNSANSLQSVSGYIQIANDSLVSTETGITAGAGGTQVAAYALTKRFSFISTVATLNDSVILPEVETANVGQRMTIKNNGANTAKIYPFGTQQINAGGASTAITIAAAATVNLVATSVGNWFTS